MTNPELPFDTKPNTKPKPKDDDEWVTVSPGVVIRYGAIRLASDVADTGAVYVTTMTDWSGPTTAKLNPPHVLNSSAVGIVTVWTSTRISGCGTAAESRARLPVVLKNPDRR